MSCFPTQKTPVSYAVWETGVIFGGISLNDETGGFLCGPVAVVGESEDFGAYFLNF